MPAASQPIVDPVVAPEAETAPAHEHVFNDDILLNDGDLAYAAEQFPRILHVLDNPQLREMFAKYENEADAARDRVRAVGFATVLFATLALLTFPTRPLWVNVPHFRWVVLALDTIGIVAAIVSSGGFWLGRWKRRWLESRLMAERLRQWHFQLLLRRGREIERSTADQNAVEEFRRRRSRWLDEFLQVYQGHLDSKLEALTGELAHAETWLHPRGHEYSPGSPVLGDVFRAYKQLRIEEQYGFALYKLRQTNDKSVWTFLKWPAIRQAAMLLTLAWVGFSVALACSAFLVYGYAFGIQGHLEADVRAVAISFAIIGFALRTLREGLAPEQEIERYNDYRGRTAQLRDRFNETTDVGKRLHLMDEMERAAVDEMRGFLRTHRRATFLLS
jgi:hypothetical protein